MTWQASLLSKNCLRKLKSRGRFIWWNLFIKRIFITISIARHGKSEYPSSTCSTASSTSSCCEMKIQIQICRKMLYAALSTELLLSHSDRVHVLVLVEQ